MIHTKNNISKVTKLSTYNTRICKRGRKADTTMRETTPRRKASQRMEHNARSALSPLCRKPLIMSNTASTRKRKKIIITSNDMTQYGCNANDLLVTEDDIVIYTTNVRLSSR